MVLSIFKYWVGNIYTCIYIYMPFFDCVYQTRITVYIDLYSTFFLTRCIAAPAPASTSTFGGWGTSTPVPSAAVPTSAFGYSGNAAPAPTSTGFGFGGLGGAAPTPTSTGFGFGGLGGAAPAPGSSLFGGKLFDTVGGNAPAAPPAPQIHPDTYYTNLPPQIKLVVDGLWKEVDRQHKIVEQLERVDMSSLLELERRIPRLRRGTLTVENVQGVAHVALKEVRKGVFVCAICYILHSFLTVVYDDPLTFR